jgi:hypothetical protein
VTTHPAAAFPLGTVLRDPETGRLAVRFQQDDTTGKGMHAWYIPARHPAEARILHHVEVSGWEPVELPPGVAEVVRVVLERQAAEVARLTRERDEAREHLDKVRRGLRTPEGWATKIHAVYVRQQRDKARDLLGAIWLHVPWRSVTRHLTTEQRELWADAVEVFGDPGSTIAVDRWWRDDAPVSGSDTTADGGQS